MELIEIQNLIKKLIKEANAEHSIYVSSIMPIPQAGSNRKYFRVESSVGNFIATYNTDRSENESFFKISEHFLKFGIPVPIVLIKSPDNLLYCQEDLGDLDLLTYALKNRRSGKMSDETLQLYIQSINQLAYLQVVASKDFNYEENCFYIKEFDEKAMLWDLNYFKYYYLNPVKGNINEPLLESEFDLLTDYLSQSQYKGFMYRDFQSRNIMIKNDTPYFIDYQGGRYGGIAYDIASLLHQAKAKLSEEEKTILFKAYYDALSVYIEVDFDKLYGEYIAFSLIRFFQTLGAYGYRGVIQKRKHFLESMKPALENIRAFFEREKLPVEIPYIISLLKS